MGNDKGTPGKRSPGVPGSYVEGVQRLLGEVMNSPLPHTSPIAPLKE
jgi:hypothetical protein